MLRVRMSVRYSQRVWLPAGTSAARPAAVVWLLRFWGAGVRAPAYRGARAAFPAAEGRGPAPRRIDDHRETLTRIPQLDAVAPRVADLAKHRAPAGDDGTE